MQKLTKYSVFFFLPGEMHNRIVDYELDRAPAPISVGDLIDGSLWDERNRGGHGIYFRVRAVTHKFLEHKNEVEHFIGVHIEELSKLDYFHAAVGRPPGGGE
jgi:hypothetical protein